MRSKNYRVYDSSFPNITCGTSDVSLGTSEANGADGFLPIGGEGCEVRPGVANTGRYTTGRKLSHMIAKSQEPLP